MLTALLHGKAGRVEIEGKAVAWRELFRKREDLLTGVLFGRLPYLTADAHNAFLSLLLGGEIASELGTLQTIEFWPKLHSGKHRGFVEPDVLINYPKHRVMVEVKPPHAGVQRLEQWRAEVRALELEEDVASPIVLLALGRNPNHSSEMVAALQLEFSDARLRVVCREWWEVMRGLGAMMANACIQDSRIIQDWLDAFGLFGMANERAPFGDLFSHLSPVEDLSDSFDVLTHWRSTISCKNAARVIDWQSLMPLVQAFKSDE
ncbi:hypothetical protein [Pseudomonas massiliensis]|uniref:hypothetical protein n=1 Tax=Pseudomonas massiliensis TaxID=522492 RepID=UPI0006943394|nr:hypothetical protein [Pseudomonas massiliensis]